jgi:hypothetical protein
MSLNTADFTSKSPTAQPHVTAHVQVGNQWRPFQAILDSGNDITLISQQTAAQLGIGKNMCTSNFKVQFGHQQTQGHNFCQVKIPMRFGNMKPFMASVGIGPVRENLIGRKDAFEHHTITFAPGGKIRLSQSNPNNNTFNIDLGGNREAHAQMNAGSRYTDTMPNNYL